MVVSCALRTSALALTGLTTLALPLPAGARTAFPVETDALLHNPLMGWGIVEYIDNPDLGARRQWAPGETPYPLYDNVQVLFTWAAIEREPGVLDWSAVDRVTDYWAGQGKTLHIIASTEYYNPREGYGGCPEWVYEMGVPRYERGAGDGVYPDYNHPVYQERLRRFLRAFADHFCDSPSIELIALRGYGAFGEWHSGHPYASVEERRRALISIIDAWHGAVAGRKMMTLSVSYEWMFPTLDGEPGILPRGTSIYDEYRPSFRDYIERGASDYAFSLPGIAARRDGVGGAVFQEYDGRLLANLFAHYRRPIFAEPFGGYGAYTSPSVVGFPNTREGDNFIENCIDEALSHHANYLTVHWGVDFDEKHPELVEKALRLLGYRLALVRTEWPDAVAPGGKLTLRQSWENRAVGRCYRPFPLALYLMRGEDVVWSGVDKSFTPAAFIAGRTHDLESSFDLPADIAPGEYGMRVALVDANGNPAIRLAIEGDDGRKRYQIGTVVVRPDAEPERSPVRPEPEATPTGFTWADPSVLRPNATLVASFTYGITRDPERDLSTDSPGWFSVYAEGGDGVRVGEARWFDKAGQGPARKTVLLALREREDYRLAWECVGGGAMAVSGVAVETLDESRVRHIAARQDWPAAVAEDLIVGEGATAFDRQRPPCPLPIVVASRDRSQVRLPSDDFDFLSTNPASVRLEPDTVYTVWFTCAARPQVWQGDYLYMRVRSDTLGSGGGRGLLMWTQRHTSNPERLAYTFRTGQTDDYRVVWGIHNGGYCEISQIVIVRRS